MTANLAKLMAVAFASMLGFVAFNSFLSPYLRDNAWQWWRSGSSTA